MDIVPAPRVIIVCFQISGETNEFLEICRESWCLVHGCTLPYVPPASFLDRMLRRNAPPAAEVRAAYDFLVASYRAGDHVVLVDSVYPGRHSDLSRHTTIRQFVTALDTGFLHKPRSGSVGERIPIKCIFFRFTLPRPLVWSGVDQLLSDLPTTVENLLCFDKRPGLGFSAYAIERGSYGRIRRKESWHSSKTCPITFRWVIVRSFCLHDNCAGASQFDAPVVDPDKPYNTIQPNSVEIPPAGSSGEGHYGHLFQLYETSAWTTVRRCNYDWGTTRTDCTSRFGSLLQEAVSLVFSKLCRGRV
ncbi:hypothetical protein BDV93DRAFT_121700 [Ceratobasidium sp. AG-I]|nr:hypothetical protein BDV93DRAFT_121700 [Ceratobasidium sp. AG-I]